MITLSKAETITARFADTTVLVAGDLILDRYVRGTVSRISPEAPVPVVKVTGEQGVPGGAANVALNIRALGGQAAVAGLVGNDGAGEELLGLLADRGVGTDGVVKGKLRTTVKTRIVAERQQVVRVDREDSLEEAGAYTGELCERVSLLIGRAGGAILEDYGKGVLTQGVVDAVLSGAGGRRVPVGFDPKDNHDLRVSGITLATPNYKEACGAAGIRERPLGEDPSKSENLELVGRTLLEKWNPTYLVITLGAHGMYIVSRGKKPIVMPTRAREVFDVSGAGDTVIATAVLCLATGADIMESAALANHAAGVVVGKLGTATCSPEELLASVRLDSM